MPSEMVGYFTNSLGDGCPLMDIFAKYGVRLVVPGGTVRVEPLEGFGPLVVEGLRVSDSTVTVRQPRPGLPEAGVFRHHFTPSPTRIRPTQR
jgi:hypothetical protein